MKIGITFESVTLNQSSESKVCSMSILGFISDIQKALEQNGFIVEIIGGIDKLVYQLSSKTFNCDLVFNAADGTEPGDEEAYIPSILRAYGIPYTGSNTSTLSVLGNKMYTKLIAAQHNIRTPDFFMIKQSSQFQDFEMLVEKLKFPMILKANAESCSISLKKCNNLKELKKGISEIKKMTTQPILCETMIIGQELTVPILGTGDDAKALSVLTYRNRMGEILEDIFSIPVKYYDNLKCEVAQVTPSIIEIAAEYARTIHIATDCISYSRSDFKVDSNGQVYFLETNPLPDLDPNGAFGVGAKADGLQFYEVIRFIVNEALKNIL